MTAPVSSRVPFVLAAGFTLIKGLVPDPSIVRYGPGVPSEDAPPVAVAWGYDGNPLGSRVAVQNWRQTFPFVGQIREESFEVLGVVAGMTGDEDPVDRVTDVFATFALIELGIRAAPLSSWSLSSPAVVEMQSGTLYQEPTTSGLRVRLPFIVAVSKIRI